MEICPCVADLIFSLTVQSHCGCMSSANAVHTSPPLQLGTKYCQSPSACSCRAWHFILLVFTWDLALVTMGLPFNYTPFLKSVPLFKPMTVLQDSLVAES